MPKPIRAAVLALMLLVLPWNSSAQTTTETSLSAPETSAFPLVTANLTVRDVEGRFVSGLAAEDILMVENGVEIPAEGLLEINPGVQIALAINPGPSFAVRDSNGISRYERVIEALDSWAAANSTRTTDKLFLVMTGLGESPNYNGYPSLSEKLPDLPTDHSEAVPILRTLSDSIDSAGGAADREEMGRAVLFITPHPDEESTAALEDMIFRANQRGVRIFVWMVTSDAFFETAGAAALQTLAESTGGRYFAFSGVEALPDLETYFDALRRTYEVSYRSELRSSGEFELAAQILAPGFEAVTDPVPLELSVSPPNPIFVSPPVEIERSLVPDSEGNLSAERRTPGSQSIEILIEFPDGYPREIVRTTLYVNGEVAAENRSAPFDTFTWDLAGITESDRYTLQVEAEDELGLSSISIETPVSISVEQLPDGISVPSLTGSDSLLVTAAVLVGGAALIMLLLRVRNLKPAPQNGNGNGRRKRRPAPVETETQPAEPANGSTAPVNRLSRWATRLHWPQRSTPKDQPIAYLERLLDPEALDSLTPTFPHPIYTQEFTLGNDPNQATLVVEEPSVAPLHARIQQHEDSDFTISDLDSIAGTYINYLPTNGDPTHIKHGDLLHIGTAGFRFRLNPEPQTPPPTIEIEDEKH